jgi:hypothetical protein
MGDIFQDVYSANSNCITTSFCLDGGSYDSTDISMPRSLKIRVIANPDFWGFGSLSGNTLIEGWGSFNEGKFDFFDGHEPDHTSLKVCNVTTTGPYKNEQRPDVGYRSVYDPENGNANYNFTTDDGIIRGGAENYLLDRASEQGRDSASCDNTDPTSIFKTNPAGYGSNPKILFNSAIYKNNTGAWKIEECDICYDTEIVNPMRVYDCSGSPKQHINADGNFANLYDPFQSRCLAPGFTSESGCGPDGTVAENYAGVLTSVVRNTGDSPFLKLTFQYDGGAASALVNGQALGIDGSSANDGVVNVFNVTHGASSTTAYAVGTVGTTNYTGSTTGTWIAFDTYDPATCCGGAAYGIDNDTKKTTNVPLYHIDIGRVFNNPKNVIYSNRIDRTYGGYTATTTVGSGVSRRDYSYVAVNESGNALLVASGAVHNIELAHADNVWDAKATHIYQLGDTYSTASGVGSIAIPTDSGFVPLFPKELPYFGSFMEVDRWDDRNRSPQGGNRETSKNSTCYTKTGSLSVFPDCLSQWTEYTDCDPKTKYTLNNVPRMAFVYKGCDYDDPCTFDDSGRPFTNSSEAGRGWFDGGVNVDTFPTGMNQLIRGFGGQEIQMFLNLGTARVSEIKREPCCCNPPPCAGTSPPEFVQIESPVTFPCFPKFDLRPSGYGCQDPIHYLHVMTQLGLSTDPSGSCSLPVYDACVIKQPYTTYGYIRNLCGKETNSRRGVIDSLSTKRHTGNYTDVESSNNTVEPMYIEFEQDTPNCCAPSGFPVATEECIEDLLGHGNHFGTEIAGTGATAEMIISSGGVITYNVLTPGSGYLYGGGVLVLEDALGDPIVDAVQRFDVTFGAANDGLSSITSSGVDSSSLAFSPVPTPPLYTPLSIPLTIVGSASGFAASGGFTYITCSPSGTVHYWGLTDYQGRLAVPYFNTKPNSTTVCGKGNYGYVDYDAETTLAGDWPKDKVPFLIEIDHEDNCTSCGTTQMPTGDMVLTVTSLPTSFSHNQASDVNTAGGVYGYNQCQYPGTAVTPYYNPATDSWDQDMCEPGDGLAATFGGAYVGETCNCADGTTFTMRARVLEGTNVPIGYVTYDSGQINNAYLPFGSCGGNVPTIADEELNVLSSAFTVYMKASMSCVDTLFSTAWYNAGVTGGLGSIFKCDGSCATSFPSPNSIPDLDLDFFFVGNQYTDLFEGLDDATIFNDVDFLENGLLITSITRASAMESMSAPTTTNCGGSGVTLNNVSTNACGAYTSTDDLEGYFKAAHCENGNENTIKLGLNLTGCIGSRIVIYGCSNYPIGSYERYKEAGNPKFSSDGSTTTFELGGCDVTVSSDSNLDCGFNAHFLANHAANATGDYSASASSKYGCVNYDSQECCLDFDETSRFSKQPFVPPFHWALTSLGCYCNDWDHMDVVYDVTKQILTNPVTAATTIGWYGTPFFQSTQVSTSPNTLYWSGENIPGIGNIGPLPIGEMIALNYQNETFQTVANFDGVPEFYNDISVEPACAFHTGPNRETRIGAQLIEPYRSTTFLDGPPNLWPNSCAKPDHAATLAVSGNHYYSSCNGAPATTTLPNIPFTGIQESITVNKKACWPEIMTVHRIDCDANGYSLHVSREYFEHDRTWYQYVEDQQLVTRLGLITGGESSLRYSCAETYLSCLDPGTGVSPTTLDYSFALKMMTPSDSLTPVHPDLCATGTDPFFLTNTSFLGSTTDDTYSSGCLYYPSISGQQFYNYYNALYDSGSPTAEFLTDAGGGVYRQPPGEDLCNESYPHDLVTIPVDGRQKDPVWTSASDIRSSHSCVQDTPECGGDLWCNKEFFPRKSYLANTRITRFGALSICTQNSQLENPSWYEGHGVTWDDSPNKEALSTSTFVDACDGDAVVLLSQAVGIDDNILFIPHNNSTGGSPSILTLMGAIHPGFKADLNEKTCIYADSGECLDFLPEHNDRSIKDITFSPDEYGYYLDKLVASGSHDCLFTPFKIMVDVECCPDRVGHRGTSDPTNLNYIATVPSTVCEGWIDEPFCTCETVSNSCALFDIGNYIPGFTCLVGVYLDEVEYVGTCQPTCEGTPPGVQDVYSRLYDFPGYLVDGTNNDPFSLLTALAPSIVEGYEGDAVCQEDCSGVYNYSAGSNEQVYSYNGGFYVSPQIINLDAFLYEGTYYRFPGKAFGEGGPDSCCYGTSGNAIVGDINTGGCGCGWTLCDMQTAIPVPTGGALYQIYDINEPVGSGLNNVTFLNSFGCIDFDHSKGCVFPSMVQFNITEA